MNNNIFENAYKDRLSQETKRLMGSMENYMQQIVKKELQSFDEYIEEKLANTPDHTVDEKDVEALRKKFYDRIKNRMFKILQQAFLQNSSDIQQAFILKLYPECFECDHNWDGPPQENVHAPSDAEILIFPDLTEEQNKTMACSDSTSNLFDIPEYEDAQARENADNPRLGPFKDSLNKKLSVYFGQYRDGLKEGVGKMYLEDGHYYEGSWKNDSPCGKAKLVHPRGSQFEGQVSETGFKGIISNFDPSDEGAERNLQRTEYLDSYLKGEAKAVGVSYYSCGSKYEGEFVSNLREGYGEFYDTNGGVFKGFWQGDKKTGKGYYIESNGNLYEEKWDCGHLKSKLKVK
jgi:hypothetical protein